MPTQIKRKKKIMNIKLTCVSFFLYSILISKGTRYKTNPSPYKIPCPLYEYWQKLSLNPPLHSLLPQILTILCILSYLLDEAREFAVSFRSSDFTCSGARCNKPNHTLATLGQFCCSEIVWMEGIPPFIVNLVAEDVPSTDLA